MWDKLPSRILPKSKLYMPSRFLQNRNKKKEIIQLWTGIKNLWCRPIVILNLSTRHPELVSGPVGRSKGSTQIKKFCVVATQKTGTTTNKKREEKIINNQKGEKKNETEKHNKSWKFCRGGYTPDGIQRPNLYVSGLPSRNLFRWRNGNILYPLPRR